MAVLGLLRLFSATVVCCCFVRCQGQLVLKDNGYEGVVIMIKDTVKEDLELIDKIQEVFTEASAFLFNATRRRAYFRDVTIVVPKRWRKSQKYQQIPAANVFYEHIRVDRKNRAKGHAPYVRGNVECGRPGWYLHLTPKFLKNDKRKRFGPYAKAIVHEWGHLRWGLFDEYGSIQHPNSSKPNHKIHFYSKNGEWQPVTCTKHIEGRAFKGCKKSKPCNIKSLKMPPSCKFCPNKKQVGVQASIMAYQWIPGVDSFCDVDSNDTHPTVRHDSTVPNMQNKMCNGRSAWEVMRGHEDFRNGANSPIDPQTNTTPTFRLVQETGRVRVLVFDTSGSMKGEKILQQKKAAQMAINTFIEKGSKLGIVKFDTYGNIEAPIGVIKGKKSKKQFKDKIPTQAGGGTEIKYGIKKAVQALVNSKIPTKGAEIVLLSDGQSNHPYLDITYDLNYRGIIVNTIAITDQADKDLAQLAKATGGHSFTYLETSTVSFADVLSQAMLSGSTDSETPVKIFNENIEMTPGIPITGTFDIDGGLGMDTSVTAMLNGTDYLLISIQVTAPNGSVYNHHEVSDIVTMDILDYTEPGEYTYLIATNSSQPVDMSVTVTSLQASLEEDVVRVKSYLSHDSIDFTSAHSKDIILFANVEKGGNPVLKANVTALLAGNQSFAPVVLRLKDSGIGADTTADDGVYSAYILKKHFVGNSRYNIKMFVTGDNGTFTYTTDVNSGEKAAVVPGEEEDIELQEIKTDRFKRQIIPGEITVSNFEVALADRTPPAKISDLVVENMEYIDNEVDRAIEFTLHWTAVGDDMDEGEAQSYDIRMHKEVDILRHNFTTRATPLVYTATPKPSGGHEVFTLKLTEKDCKGTCYVALRATDDEGLQGDISNIVSVDVNFTYQPVEDDADDDAGESEEGTNEVIGEAEDGHRGDAVTIVGSVSVIFMTVLLYIV